MFNSQYGGTNKEYHNTHHGSREDDMLRMQSPEPNDYEGMTSAKKGDRSISSDVH